MSPRARRSWIPGLSRRRRSWRSRPPGSRWTEGERRRPALRQRALHVQYTAVPKVCGRNGASVFSLCVYPTQRPTRRHRDAGQEVCVGLGSFFSGLFTSGLAEAVITTPCQERANLNLQLAQDALYVTKVDLDDQFLVIGRSRLMDSVQSWTGRAPADLSVARARSDEAVREPVPAEDPHEIAIRERASCCRAGRRVSDPLLVQVLVGRRRNAPAPRTEHARRHQRYAQCEARWRHVDQVHGIGG